MPRKRTSPDVQTGGDSLAPAKVQPELFSPDMLPPRPDLVQMVKAKAYEHTGKILTKDEELCLGVCKDLLLGLSDRQVAKKWGISRNSIVSIELALREQGKLEPLKQAISNELGEVIVMGLRNYKDALAANTVPAGQIPIPMAALIDKKGQLDANVVPGTSLHAEELTVEALREQLARLKSANAPIDVVAVENQSNGIPAKSQ